MGQTESGRTFRVESYYLHSGYVSTELLWCIYITHIILVAFWGLK